MNKRKLLKLADILEAAHRRYARRKGGINPDNQYNQRWFAHDFQGKEHRGCGSPACALGHWAAAHPRTWFTDWLGEVGIWRDAYITGDNRRSASAGIDAEDEFGLDGGQVKDLFGVAGCGGAKTAREASKYIREFVRHQS